ncbi:aminopeptidase I zinc metalloprotease family protein [Rhodococcus sp. MTM3W5.2]|nr:aminopeptidase I zinc metalloprotease family protein [Rhodococcus sp. MTM3W5.2]
MPQLTDATATGLCSFVDASPSPFHVCETVAAELTAAGFVRLRETQGWPSAPGRYFLVRGGSLVAWSTEASGREAAPFRIVGGHTDSPNLRVKQHPDLESAGWQLVGLEPYGGAWLNSWLDRDLGISGRLSIRDGNTLREKLIRVDRPILRVPQLAIHLSEDRKGVQLDPQRHVNAIWGVGSSPRRFLGFLAEEAGVDQGAVLGWELMTHDLAPSAVVGPHDELVSAPRLDNQGTCYAGSRALLAAVENPAEAIPVLALFDHEEVGSMSDRGAFSDLLNSVLERIVLARGGGREDFLRAMAGSVCASGTWRTPPTRTTRTGTSPRTGSRSTVARCSRSTRTCATPPMRQGRAPSPSPAIRRVCRCSATCTARTCRVVPPSDRSPRRGPGCPPSTWGPRNSRCTRRGS